MRVRGPPGSRRATPRGPTGHRVLRTRDDNAAGSASPDSHRRPAAVRTEPALETTMLRALAPVTVPAALWAVRAAAAEPWRRPSVASARLRPEPPRQVAEVAVPASMAAARTRPACAAPPARWAAGPAEGAQLAWGRAPRSRRARRGRRPWPRPPAPLAAAQPATTR